ncbi:tyrosine-type recombinase/integrase [Azospirillum melinis]|uniref:tyrosine-type recombinase/integrase n=1 Tax=Azospirillum melinis TaxID=328839 RepID=UPI003756E653
MAIDIKNGKHRVRVRYNGTSYTSLFTVRTEAEEWERKAKVGELPEQLESRLEAAPRDVREVLFKEVVESYLLRVTPTKKGARSETYRLKKLMGSSLGRMRLADIRLHHIQSYADTLAASGAAPSTIYNNLSPISEVFKEAMRQERYACLGLRNPTFGVRKPPSKRPRDVQFTQDMEDALVEVTRRSPLPWLYPIAMLAALTGMRQGELRAFRLRDVGDCFITLVETKNGDLRRVPLSRQAKDVLQEWLEDKTIRPDERVFELTEQQVSQSWRDAWDSAERKYGHPHITFHDLRHVATTRLSKRLTNVLELSAVTGHRSIQTLKRYYNPDPAELAKKLG